MKVVVIGGGITGLLSAIALRKAGADVKIVSENWGGLIGGYNVLGYQFDHGGHVFTAKDEATVRLLRQIPSATLHKSRRAFYIDRTGIYIPYPVQSHADVLGLKINNHYRYDGYRHDNFESWSEYQFGKEFTEGFMKPFNERVWSSPMKTMDSDWIATRVQTDIQDGSYKTAWGPNSSFWYVRGQELIFKLMNYAGQIGVTFVTGHASISPMLAASNLIEVSNIGQLSYDWLVSTMPINTLIGSLKWPLLANAKSNNVLTILLALNHEIDADFHWVYNTVGQKSHRITLLSRYAEGNAPKGKDSLLVEVPFSNDFSAWADKFSSFLSGYPYPSGPLNDGAVSAVLEDIGHIGNIEAKHVRFGSAEVFSGYPIPSMKIRADVAMIKRWLLGRSIISCGRWGSHAYFNLEHCIREADAVTSQITHSQVGPMIEYLWSTFYYGAYNDPNNRGN